MRLRIVRWISLLTIGVGSGVAGADSSSLEYKEPSQKLERLGSSEKQKIISFLSEIESSLPQKLKGMISRKVSVEFQTLDHENRLILPACWEDLVLAEQPVSPLARKTQMRGHVYGKVLSSDHEVSVILNRHFIPEIVSGKPTYYSCGHKNGRRLAAATVIHELGHIIDDQSGFSSQPLFAEVAGWRKQWTLRNGFPRSQRPRNHSGFRSPDPYESKSLKEHFAVNLEYLILDSQFPCRRPVYSLYYSRLLEFEPAQDCSVPTQVKLQSIESGLFEEQYADIDPRRVFEIHYFPATEGTHISSRFGHAMYRLVICAPETAEVDAQCLTNPEDLKHHVVVGYGARENDARTSLWKGLMGKYPSEVAFYRLDETVEKYTRIEFRDLGSLPLKISEEEKERFIYRLLEDYWTYQGAYYFLTNSCNDEAIHLLKGSTWRDSVMHLRAMTPIRLYKKLERVGLVDSHIWDDRKTARSEGYYFESSRLQLAKAFSVLQAQMSDLELAKVMLYRKLDRYLEKSTADERRSLYSNIPREAGRSMVRVAASLNLLESAIYLKKRNQLNQAYRLALEERDTRSSQLCQRTLQIIQNSIPKISAKRGYGIAMPEDFDGKSYALLQEETVANSELVKELQEWSNVNFKDELEELEYIQDNIDYLTKWTSELLRVKDRSLNLL